VEETGTTYAENAALKAVAAHAATGLPALGDDSGLEVEVLGGEPGLHSRRLGPTQAARNAELWRRLAEVPRPWKARFVAALALAPGPRLFEGRVEGELLPEARGSSGFGYDPIFLLPELGRTFAELEPAQKQRWSHRGRAAQALLASGALSSIE
jgi:XTP/dITP diphosphohydrolase